MKTKTRMHNEHFTSVGLSGRKSCPECREKLQPGEKIWSWFEYVRVQRRRVQFCCKACFTESVKPRLLEHAGGCGCTIELQVHVGFNEVRPGWLTLETEVACD
jgi:hypothetical protein